MIKYLSIPLDFNSDAYYRFNKMASLIAENIGNKTQPIRILDIGCGDGQFLKYLQEKNPQHKFEFYGIDQYVDYKSFEFVLINRDLEDNLPFEKDYFDVVICGEIFEHIRKTDLLAKEIYRVLHAEGFLILSTPNLASYFNRLLLLIGYQPYHSEVSDLESGFGQDLIYKILGISKLGNKTAGHLRMFTYSAMSDFLDYHGFVVGNYAPVFFSTFRPNNPRIFIIKAFFLLDKIVSNVFPRMASGMIFLCRKKIL